MKSVTLRLVQGALMVALATVLSVFAVYKLPNGGSITFASMVPIIFFSYLYDVKWGLLTALVYSAIQMLIGFYPPPANDLLSFVLVVLLDYVVAFGVLGLAGWIAKPVKNKVASFVTGAAVVIVLRFLCHFLSGILIWNSFAPEGQPVWLYSLVYNGSYMLGELIISTIVIGILAAAVDVKQLTGRT